MIMDRAHPILELDAIAEMPGLGGTHPYPPVLDPFRREKATLYAVEVPCGVLHCEETLGFTPWLQQP
jgi:hypothetical protein